MRSRAPSTWDKRGRHRRADAAHHIFGGGALHGRHQVQFVVEHHGVGVGSADVDAYAPFLDNVLLLTSAPRPAIPSLRIRASVRQRPQGRSCRRRREPLRPAVPTPRQRPCISFDRFPEAVLDRVQSLPSETHVRSDRFSTGTKNRCRSRNNADRRHRGRAACAQRSCTGMPTNTPLAAPYFKASVVIGRAVSASRTAIRSGALHSTSSPERVMKTLVLELDFARAAPIIVDYLRSERSHARSRPPCGVTRHRASRGKLPCPRAGPRSQEWGCRLPRAPRESRTAHDFAIRRRSRMLVFLAWAPVMA